MNLNLSKEAITDKINATILTSIQIETKLERGITERIKYLLKKNPDIEIILVIDPSIISDDQYLANLDIIPAIGAIKHLCLFCFGSKELDSLKPLEETATLRSFRLSGYYNKKIDLTWIGNNAELKKFELEYGLADKKQLAFVNRLTKLRQLKVSTLDLGLMTSNKNVHSLIITNSLKNAETIDVVYPSTSRFEISYAKAVDSFDFLYRLQQLEILSIGYTTKLIVLPKLNRPDQLKKLLLLNVKNFNDLESIPQFKNLETLAVTGSANIVINDIQVLFSLKKLKRVYIDFKAQQDMETFERIANENNWIPNLLKY